MKTYKCEGWLSDVVCCLSFLAACALAWIILAS